MTTITPDTLAPDAAPPRPRTALTRVLNVVHLQLGNSWTTIGLPWLILGFIFLVNLAIWLIIAATTSPHDAGKAREGLTYSGSSFYIFIYMMVLAIQAFSITFR